MSTPTPAERPGALARDSTRTILVIAQSGELAVALRERVDRAFALVRDVRPQEASDGLSACRPWPWMVVGEVPHLAAPLRTTLWTRPVLTYWRGVVPEGLPAHVRRFSSFGSLADAVSRALAGATGGLRLAPGVGVELPDGRLSRSPELQALVSAYPRPFHLPRRVFSRCTRVLVRTGLCLQTLPVGGTGLVLGPAGHPTPARR